MKKDLVNIKKRISNLKDFTPSKEVNNVFSNLVEIATSFNKKDLSLKNFFQETAKKAEIEMEIFWANKIINSSNPEKTLKEFWYYKNYLDLTKLEYGSLSICKDHKKHSKVIFVGSGPLPLTGIFLAKEFSCEVTFMDIDKNSLNISKKLCEKLNIKNIHFELADAYKYKKYENFEIIFIAAMIENKNKDKEDFINEISKKIKKHTHVLIRSVFHNRELLYKKFDVKKIKGLKEILEVRPKNEIINSFHVYEK